MIQLVIDDRCIRCAACIRVCPDDVFEADGDGLPVIARQNDCQTCFLCEVYCPTDALYVSPEVSPTRTPEVRELEERDLVGHFARDLGWQRGRPPRTGRGM